jgi:hypothetical protein
MKATQAKPNNPTPSSSSTPSTVINSTPFDALQVTACKIDQSTLVPGDGFTVSLKVKNVNPFRSSYKWAIFLEEDLFFACSTSEAFDPLPSSGTALVSFNVSVKSVSNIEHLPHFKKLSLINEQEMEIGIHNMELSIAPYVKYLSSFRHLNIILCGMFGTGKSSFVNSAYSLLNPDPQFRNTVLYYAIASSSTTSVTSKFTRYISGKKSPGSQRAIPAKVNVTLVDTWGFEPSKNNFPPFILPFMLNGSLPDSWDMEELSTFMAENLSADKSNTINVAFIVTTPGAADNSQYLDFITNTLLPEFTKRCTLIFIYF